MHLKKITLSYLLSGHILLILSLMSSSCSNEPPEAPAPKEKVVVGYFIEWGIYGRAYDAQTSVPIHMLTHLNYAFAQVSPQNRIALIDPYADIEADLPGNDPSLPFKGNFNQLVGLKKRNPSLKTLISVGGWTKSKNFSTMAKIEEGRRTFASSCVNFIRTYQFDGVDLDWEYPGGGGMEGTDFDPQADKTNFTLLLKELRSQLDEAGEKDGKYYLLTAATAAGMDKITHLELAKIGRYLNFINIMAYDMHMGFTQLTNHQGPLYVNPSNPEPDIGPLYLKSKGNIDAVVKAYVEGGFPREKIVIGVPFYGRAWTLAGDGGQGPFQKATGELPRGTWEPGCYDYDDVLKNLEGQFYFDEQAQAAYFIGTEKRGDKPVKVFISLDNPQSLERKVTYVKQNGLAGIMFWELTSNRDNTLLETIWKGLK